MIPDFVLYKSFLAKKVPEGERAFESMWKELKEKGYLKQYKIKDPNNSRFTYQYELLEVPDTTTPGTILIDSNGEVVEPGEQQKEETKVNNDDINNIKEQIKDNIDYEAIKEQEGERLDNIVDIMADVITSTAPTTKVNGVAMATELVKQRFLTLDSDNICYVTYCIDNIKEPIKNMRSYLITSLYNAPSTMCAYWENKARQNL